MRERVIILGAGVMGAALAQQFVRTGFGVAVIDPAAASLARAEATIGAKTAQTAFATELPALDPLWRDSVLAIEAVPEQLLLKQSALAALEDWLPAQTLIASNTSGITTRQLAERMRHPERLAIAHFFNPADVIPVVELLAGPDMPDARLETLAQILRRAGKLPAVLRKEVPGFVANRIQHAMMREAFHLLEEGVADAETIDEIVRWSLGVRLAFFGPFLQRDLNGLDTHLSIAEYLYGNLSAATQPAEPLREKVAAGATGRKAGTGFYRWDAEREAAIATAQAALVTLIADQRREEAPPETAAEAGRG